MSKLLAKDIKGAGIIKSTLDGLKSVNEYIDKLDENSFEYENLCEKVEEHYLEIDEALVEKENFSNETIFNAHMRREVYWEYIKEEITWNQFVNKIKKYSDKLLIDII